MDRRRPKVLLVDDTPANLRVLDGILSKLQCERLQADSGNEALQLMLEHDFAVVLLDVQMAGMDGYEVATLARSNPATHHVPIIFVTAMSPTDENEMRGYGAGAVDYLFKPINSTVLRSKVQVFLELWQGRQRLADEVTAHRETMAELEAFNYSVSHDLRAPVRHVQGFASALLQKTAGQDSDLAKLARRIESAGEKMSQLIDDMLRLSKLTRQAMNVRTVDLAKIASSIVAELRAIEPLRETEFICAPSAPVAADEALVRIAMDNLLRNAWKFTRGRTPARLEFGAEVTANANVYFVRDNGAGFDGKHSERLFQPFQRMHSDSEFEGTGIGLAIVQRVVRRHGWTIHAESSPGSGATFFLTAPRSRDDLR